MKKKIIIKANGEIVQENIINKGEINSVYGLNQYKSNICGECSNCSASKCIKVEDDSIDKDIRKYDFITDGFQINDRNEGTLDNLVVEKCNNFEKDLPRKKAQTMKEIVELNRLKESIKMLYYDAGDLDEADNIQYKENCRRK